MGRQHASLSLSRVCGLVCLLWCAFAATARAERAEERLERAEQAYRSADYNAVLQILGTIEDADALPHRDERIHAYRLLGLSELYLNHPQLAHQAFFGLLKQDPYYELTLEPPDTITFFNKVRQDENVSLEPIRAAIQEERRRQEEGQRQMEEALRKADEISRLSKLQLQPPEVIERRVSQGSTLVALMPFGLGQFQNGNTKLGVAFAVGEGITAIGSIVSYLAVELMREPDGTFSSTNYPFARRFNGAKWISAGIFYALWAAGAVEANVNFVNERVIETAPSAAPDHPLTPPTPAAVPAASQPAIPPQLVPAAAPTAAPKLLPPEVHPPASLPAPRSGDERPTSTPSTDSKDPSPDAKASAH